MLIAGAGGHAIEVLQLLHPQFPEIFFYDDSTPGIPGVLFTYSILNNTAAATQLFQQDPSFVLGTGTPAVRRTLAGRLAAAGGQLRSVIAPNASVGSFEVNIGEGVNIMEGVFISNRVTIGEGALINARAMVHHDCTIGEYAEIGPGAIITGNCSIGHDTILGAGAIVIPGVTIGHHVVVGAGAVVVNDIADNAVVMGVPAKAKCK